MSVQPPAPAQDSFPCGGCGSRLEYAPGTNSLRCPYCGQQQRLAAPSRKVREHSIAELAAKPRVPAQQIAAHNFVCHRCGARTQATALAQSCQFCAASLVDDTSGDTQIAPEAVLAFALDRNDARTAFQTWVKSRWFAPGALKKITATESMKSTYLPHWTFDARTTSRYVGRRGEHYYESETYRDGTGNTRTRQVRRTRWYPAEGTIRRNFDDVLIPATTQTSPEKLAKLEPWPLKRAVAYQPGYLAGHHALRYDIEPDHGLAQAKTKMARLIEKECRRAIGGDEQQIHSVDTQYSAITYKHMLLPVWIGAYIYQESTYQILINGCSGEVQGERPISMVKAAAAITAAILVVAAIIGLYLMYRGG